MNCSPCTLLFGITNEIVTKTMGTITWSHSQAHSIRGSTYSIGALCGLGPGQDREETKLKFHLPVKFILKSNATDHHYHTIAFSTGSVTITSSYSHSYITIIVAIRTLYLGLLGRISEKHFLFSAAQRFNFRDSLVACTLLVARSWNDAGCRPGAQFYIHRFRIMLRKE